MSLALTDANESLLATLWWKNKQFFEDKNWMEDDWSPELQKSWEASEEYFFHTIAKYVYELQYTEMDKELDDDFEELES